MASQPRIELTQRAVEPDRNSNLWRITWRLKNLAPDQLRVASVRFPHQQFKADERAFEPPLDLNGSAEVEFELPIQCDEPAGVVTENAFAIFYATWFGEPWRIFVR